MAQQHSGIPVPPDPIVEADLLDDPIAQFVDWLQAAEESGNLDPYAMTLATNRPDGTPTARMVLLKVVDERGFVFCSHYDGPKAQDIVTTPNAALVFYWPEIQRQVRISGPIERIDPDRSNRLFAARPRESRLAATLGGQSREIESRDELERRFEEAVKAHEGREILRPDTWGGFGVKPTRIEFWQAGPHRLHDRFLYEKVDDGWKIKRLAP